MLGVDVYGSLVHLPDNPLETLIDGWGLPPSEQIWRRKELPAIFNSVDFDKDGNAILTPEQRRYALQEVERCKKGYYFFNNGQVTYITGKHYFYLTYWFLEDSIYPEYRDTDRRYFLFLNFWEHILWCLGILRGKKRREGASSQATSNLVYECIFYTNSNCGLVSKTNIDSRDTFTDMVRHGYNNLPVFLKPRQLNRADSVTELVFDAKIEKGGDAGGGMKSKINYRAPVLNAYDRGRLSRGLFDEGGKWPIDVDFANFLAIVSKTMVKGAKRVGFAECPSTVNELTKGGVAFKKAWNGANQFKYPNKPTPNRFVTYFSAAYDGYEGFIDKHGMSVISEPTHEQYQYLVDKWVKKDPITGVTISELTEEDIKLGAKVYVMIKRREGLDGDLLEEEIRMNPCTVDEMFMAANTGCIFNSFKINERIKQLNEKPVYKRKVLFYRDETTQTIKWRDTTKEDQNFYWEITAFPPDGEENKFTYEEGKKKPGRVTDGVIGVDGYSNSQGGKKYGSKASAWIFRKMDIRDPENTNRLIGHLYGRPKEKDELHEQVSMAAIFFGYIAWYEFTADDYYTFFKRRGLLGYLGKFPKNSIDPEKLKEGKKIDRFYGFPINDFAMTKQNDVTISYVENYCDNIDWIELLEDMLPFDPAKRTPSDRTVSASITFVCATELTYEAPKRKIPIVRTYANPNYHSN